jgi:hypothetical protein
MAIKFFLGSGRVTTVPETPLSKFIRNASSGEKKRVYSEVLRKASESQVRVLEEVRKEHSAQRAAAADSKKG